MSRIGKLPIEIPEKVKIEIVDGEIRAQGPNGKGAHTLGPKVNVRIDGNQLLVERPDDSAQARSMHGLTRTLLNNLVVGVHEGFTKVLEINGVGFRAEVQGSELHMNLGFSHPVVFPLPAGVSAAVERQTRLTLKSSDKQMLGETAAKIRALRPPEPYKGKGIKYSDEVIRRKQGKTGAS